MKVKSSAYSVSWKELLMISGTISREFDSLKEAIKHCKRLSKIDNCYDIRLTRIECYHFDSEEVSDEL